MKNSKQLRTWLVDEAARQRMSQAEMARRTNKSAATYSRILDGTTKELNQETVDAICAWAGIDQIALLEIAIGQTPSSRGSTSAPNPAWRTFEKRGDVARLEARVAELEAECAQLQGAFTSRKVSACCDASVSFGPNPVCPKCDRSCSVIDVMTPQKGGKELKAENATLRDALSDALWRMENFSPEDLRGVEEAEKVLQDALKKGGE